MKQRARWAVGVVLMLAVLSVVMISNLPILFYPGMPFIPLFRRAFFILLISCLLCLFRIFRGPTAADRAVAIDILGILILGFCAILGVSTGRNWYIDIGIAWALQSFIGTLALAKYLEGRSFDD